MDCRVQHRDSLGKRKLSDALAHAALPGDQEALVRPEVVGVSMEDDPRVRGDVGVAANTHVEPRVGGDPQSVEFRRARRSQRAARSDRSEYHGRGRRQGDDAAPWPNHGGPQEHGAADRVWVDSGRAKLRRGRDTAEPGDHLRHIIHSHESRVDGARSNVPRGVVDVDCWLSRRWRRTDAQAAIRRSPRRVESRGRRVSEERWPTGGRRSACGTRRTQHLVTLSERFRSVTTSGGRVWRVTRAAKGI